MSTVYTKDLNLRVTFRCDDKLSVWIMEQATSLGLTPSAFVRQVLFSQMAQQVRITKLVEKSILSSAKAMNEKLVEAGEQ